jgi:hypothetical protein
MNKKVGYWQKDGTANAAIEIAFVDIPVQAAWRLERSKTRVRVDP